MESKTLSTVLRSASIVALAAFSVSCARLPPGSFKEPAEAVQALHDVIGANDEKKVDELFGPGSMEMFRSGDDVADQDDYARVKALIKEKVGFEDHDATTKIALFGNDEWPFSVPLVTDGKSWRFDSAKGREEIANRRVGRNELLTMASLRAIVDAQREYAEAGRDDLPPQYARRFRSAEGKHDGLYWQNAEGEPESPLGELAAVAASKGYDVDRAADAPAEPFHGYQFRILDAQGKSAPGGAKSYVDAAGNMTGGFAILAWPAKHGMSGVMTMMVSDRGIVFEKDLGKDTETAADAIKEFDPDGTWEPTYDPDPVPEDDEAAAEEAAEAESAVPVEPAPATGAAGG